MTIYNINNNNFYNNISPLKTRNYIYNYNIYNNNIINIFNKGGQIKIKKNNKGSFIKYCNGKVTSECIKRGKQSPYLAIRKKAIFAENSRKWKHYNGGILNYGI